MAGRLCTSSGASHFECQLTKSPGQRWKYCCNCQDQHRLPVRRLRSATARTPWQHRVVQTHISELSLASLYEPPCSRRIARSRRSVSCSFLSSCALSKDTDICSWLVLVVVFNFHSRFLMCCWCITAALAERGKTSEQVGQAAAEELLEGLAHGGCVDGWLQDQLIIFMAVAQGRSVVTCGEPTLHTRTAIMVCEVLTSAKFAVKQLPSSVWEISCTGAGNKAGRTAET